MNATDVVGKSGLITNFYNNKGYASVHPENQKVWNDIAKVDGFNENTDRFIIYDIMMKKSITNIKINKWNTIINC